MNFKRVLLNILISFLLIIPINAYAYSKYLIPGGDNIGIKVYSDGVYVVGFYPVNNKYIAKDAGLKVGDLIVSINDELVENISDLINKFEDNKDKVSIKIGYLRNGVYNNANLSLSKDQDNIYKTGIYVKDSITGIGTLTYINPDNNTFGALGHIINESNTNKEFTINNGKIYSSKVTGIIKSSLGKPGEKNARINNLDILGTITKNQKNGIFGKIDKDIDKKDKIEIGSIDEVKIGKAEIITVVSGNNKEKYEIEILSIDKNSDTKNFLVQIIDKNLLNKTGGIVKGMSGSPIIQNGKIIGAITHALVDNPEKGYGIGIENMLKE